MTLKVLVFGSGKRVRETALPAFARASQSFEIASVLARTAKTIEAAGAVHDVRAIDTLQASEVAAADLVYLAVTKDAVPNVLQRLAALDVARVDCLIDTPVVRFKHFCHARHLSAFRNAWVAEDCVELPWIETLRAVVASGVLGELKRAELDRSAYAYHGLATTKALLGTKHVRSARRRPRRGASGQRVIRFAGGTEAHVVEPRDYSVGRVRLVGARATISDHPDDGADLLLEPIVTASRWSGFRAGEIETRLDDDEMALAEGEPSGETVIQRMDAMKRVGFLRLLRRIAAGTGAYPVTDAMDDMVVDYHLEKLGEYRANPFTSARSPLARALLGAVTRVAGG